MRSGGENDFEMKQTGNKTFESEPVVKERHTYQGAQRMSRHVKGKCIVVVDVSTNAMMPYQMRTVKRYFITTGNWETDSARETSLPVMLQQ